MYACIVLLQLAQLIYMNELHACSNENCSAGKMDWYCGYILGSLSLMPVYSRDLAVASLNMPMGTIVGIAVHVFF